MNGHRRGTVIELLGAPAAGKTQLAEALARLEGVTVVKDHRRADLSALAWSMARSLPVAVTPPHDVDRLRWAAWAGRLSAASRIASVRLATGASTVVFDQGAAYTLVRMLDLRDRPSGGVWWWNRCLETAGLLDLLVLLDADTTTLANRVHRRGKNHVSLGLAPSHLHDYLSAERRACHLVADLLAREGAEVRRIITTQTPVEEQVGIVRESLARHLDHHVR